MISAALAYAEIGWAVLPVDPKTKQPLTIRGATDATTDPDRVKKLWSRHPEAAIGINAGRSGLVVIDVDPRNEGLRTLEQIERVNGPLWDTSALLARSGGGGFHYVYRASPELHVPAKLGPGIDVIAGNRYFIAPPSRHPSGNRYQWEATAGPFDASALAAMPAPPAWLVGPNTGGNVECDALAQIDPAEPETPERVALVLSALKAIDPDCTRDEYLRVLFALHSTGWDDAIERFGRPWASGSMHGSTAEKYSDKGFRSDVRRLRSDKPRAVTLGSLFEIAKGHGWDDPRKATTLADTFGDADNGSRFAARHRGRFLFVHAARKWLRWDGQRWANCEKREEKRAALEVLREALTDAHKALAEAPTDRNRASANAALSAYRNERRADALLNVAAVGPGMSIASPADLDANPFLLGVRNGVVDLRTGTLLAADPDLLISRQACAAFDRSAECPLWLDFLGTVFEHDTEIVEFMQRACGYALTGLVTEEKLFFMFGGGANGKSVFANVMNEVLGEYAATLRSVALARDPKGNGAEAEREKTRLPGARLVLINEVAASDVFDDQRVKEIVSRERISARHLYAESFDFMPTHKIFVRGNHQPGAMDASDGFWRRIVLIPFARQFTEGERIADLDRRIVNDERNGVFMWMLEGCLNWQRNGLQLPKKIKAASDAYRRDTDILGEWLESRCRLDPTAQATSSALFRSYQDFLRSLNMNSPSAKVFGRQLGQRGLSSRRSNGQTIYAGLALREWGEE